MNADELELISTIKNAPGSIEAAHAVELLCETNRPFVHRLARRHARRRHVDLDDLVQAGLEGLLAALQRFELERGVRFQAYARHDIEGAIRAAAADMGRSWRIPEHVRAKLMKKQRALERLTRAGNFGPTRNQIADEIGESDEAMDYIDGVSSNVARIDTYVPNTPGAHEEDAPAGLHERIPETQRIDGWSAPRPTAEEHVERSEQHAQIDRLLAVLNARQRDVVVLYYGLNGAVMSLTKIGRWLGQITKQAVAKIVNGALERVRFEAEALSLGPEDRKPRLTAPDDAFRAFMRRRVDTVRRHPRYDWFDAENNIFVRSTTSAEHQSLATVQE
jgi:RNA polymerase sigma factor (sigma-70 family)